MNKTLNYLLLSFCAVLYFIQGLAHRTEFFFFLAVFAVLFTIYFFYISRKDFEQYDIHEGIKLGLLFRIACLFYLPNLSDDYHRFIWDGVITQHGINPFDYTPTEIAATVNIRAMGLEHTLNHLNSPDYYSVYPPVNQFIFYIATYWGAFPAVFIMKLFILLAEYGTVKLLISLLKKWNLNPMKAMIYFLNPLVIVELTGNLHFEAVMIFFLVLSVYLLVKNKTYLAGIAYALAILTKVIPLLFLPFFIKRLGWKRSLLFFSTIGVFTVGISALYFNLTQLQHFFTSVQLYFGNFRFNASIYQWLKSFGELFFSYEIMKNLSSLLSILVLVTIVIWVLKEKKTDLKSIFTALLLALTLHLLLATTVHPWYITTGVALAVFTNYRYVLVWSALAVLSYVTYINEDAYQELFWLNAIEYIVVIGWLVYELKYKSPDYVGT